MIISKDSHSDDLKGGLMVSRSQALSSTFRSSRFMTDELYLSAWAIRTKMFMGQRPVVLRGRKSVRIDNGVMDSSNLLGQFNFSIHKHDSRVISVSKIIAHQTKSADRFLPSIFHSQYQHVDCKMSVC